MKDDWVFIMIATPFLVGLRVVVPESLFSSKLQDNTIIYNALWLLQIAVPTATNVAAIATHHYAEENTLIFMQRLLRGT